MYNAGMLDSPWRISLRHFMILGAIVPPTCAVAAGVFGEIPSLVFWILVISFLWFGLGWATVLGLIHCARLLGGWLDYFRGGSARNNAD